jgi:hypothetical protein
MVSLLLAALLSADSAPASERATLAAPWGRFEETEKPLGLWRVVLLPSAEGWQTLPATLPPLVRAVEESDPEGPPLLLEWSNGASPGRLRIPPAGTASTSAPRAIRLETAEATGQFPDGRVVLRPADGARNGAPAPPTRDQPWIALGTLAEDFIAWNHTATRPGTYDVELSAAPRESGISAEFSLDDQTVSRELPMPEADSVHLPTTLGRLAISRPGDVVARLRLSHRGGNALAKIGAIVLRPASEGRPVVQAQDGSVSCHARDVTIHGIQVQCEPKPQKNTIGYWTNPNDRVSWAFALEKPGTFQVEILQGCGKGQGGSEVVLTVGGRTFPFVVEDTGHFQNFVRRTIGTVSLERPGRYRIEVRPVRKAGVAVMDLRQVRLTPAE